MQTRRGVATVSRCMKRLGLSQLKALEPPMPVVRYERTSAGELLHIDTKRLGRIDGIGLTSILTIRGTRLRDQPVLDRKVDQLGSVARRRSAKSRSSHEIDKSPA